MKCDIICCFCCNLPLYVFTFVYILNMYLLLLNHFKALFFCTLSPCYFHVLSDLLHYSDNQTMYNNNIVKITFLLASFVWKQFRMNISPRFKFGASSYLWRLRLFWRSQVGSLLVLAAECHMIVWRHELRDKQRIRKWTKDLMLQTNLQVFDSELTFIFNIKQ